MTFLGLRWSWLLVIPVTGFVFIAGLDGVAPTEVGVSEFLSAVILAYVFVRISVAVASRVRSVAAQTIDDQTTKN